ncbi:hypothetical protein [Nostoc linckia]|uniref:hypothetical protein n=1 Tax=Nostoc linckia TaxID=92942 RepID=UPI000BFFE803|nr:hypothetical protein [Nostoc linckia]PHK07853.1 hypothetical protein VF11_37660 [Nostoc linckia z14]
MGAKELVSDELAEKCISAIANTSAFKKSALLYEIQDDFNFVLISVATDGVSDVSPLDRKEIARLVDAMIPKRSGDYSWMINFLSDGTIIDSYFGGDLMSPGSGM